MLAYPPFMQRSPFAAVGAIPQSLPGFPQLSLGPQFPFTCSPPPTAAFALHAQIPTLPYAADGKVRQEPRTPDSKHAEEPPTPKASQSSFSIASILGKDEKKAPRSATRSPPVSSNGGGNSAHSCCRESVSPSTPLSAGPCKPGSFYYFYPPPQAPSPFPFATAPAQACLDAELQRNSCALGRLTAPVAVINEIVRHAGTLILLHKN